MRTKLSTNKIFIISCWWWILILSFQSYKLLLCLYWSSFSHVQGFSLSQSLILTRKGQETFETFLSPACNNPNLPRTIYIFLSKKRWKNHLTLEIDQKNLIYQTTFIVIATRAILAVPVTVVYPQLNPINKIRSFITAAFSLTST